MAGGKPRAIVIGIGNLDRDDDGAGRIVAQRLRGGLPADVAIAEADGEPASLLALLDGVDFAILVDACRSGAAAGSVLRFDASVTALPEKAFAFSTHGLGLGHAIELARALRQLPTQTIVYAIEAESLEPGAAISHSVETAIVETCRRIAEEIKAQ
jgi:hydrogenase maturation protease